MSLKFNYFSNIPLVVTYTCLIIPYTVPLNSMLTHLFIFLHVLFEVMLYLYTLAALVNTSLISGITTFSPSLSMYLLWGT